MNLYFAPLEGIGGYIYRNAQADYFEKARSEEHTSELQSL